MISNYLKVALRNLARHKLSTFINMIGLSIGIACCVLIMLFVIEEASFDHFNKNRDSIYRILKVIKQSDGETELSAYEPMPLIPALRSEYPEIIHAARFSTGGTIISFGQKSFTETVLFTDPDVFKMFTITFIAGDPFSVLQDPAEIVLTKKMAQKYFGDEEPMGKILRVKTYSGEGDFRVSAIVEEMPENSTIKFDFLANIKKHSMYEKAKERWSSSNGSAFIQLPPGISPRTLEEKLPVFVQKYLGEVIQRAQDEGFFAKVSDAYRLRLQPLPDVHWDTDVGGGSPERIGDISYSLILGGIGVLILTIACINFITLTIGRSRYRAKEVGVRKVLGAIRSQLVSQFLEEALVLCIAAMLAGIVLAELILPTFNQLAQKHLTLNPFSDAGLIIGLMTLLVLVGLAAGSYPALYLSRFIPTETLKGQFRLGGRSLFTRILVTFQFGLSIFLMCAALVLSQQIDFLITRNLGFNPQQVVVLPMHAGSVERAVQISDRFKAQVAGNASILGVAATSGAFTRGYDIQGLRYKGENKSSYLYRVDENYLPTLGIGLKYGRNFSRENAEDRANGIIVNERFLKEMGWPEPGLGTSLAGVDSKSFEKYRVIGVVPDFNFTSLRREIRPVMMFMNPEWNLDDLLIRISPKNIPATIEYLRQVWQDIAPSTPFEPSFLDEDFRKQYEGEMRWRRIVTFGSGVALTLACLGLFGLAALAIANRTKEIGIRKVLGASGPGIVRLVSGEFLRLVVIANIIAWPLAYLAASSFLENYAYRITLTPLIFIASGAAALVIAFLAITAQIIKAVRANPVEALRYE